MLKLRKPHRAAPRPEPARLFAQPGPAFYTLPELELRGKYLAAQGCRRVLEFSPDKICLDIGPTLVTLYGRALRIESLVGKRLILAGEVTHIEFRRKWPDPAAGNG